MSSEGRKAFTIATGLICKFMDDMDAEEMDGSRGFFAGNSAKHGWSKPMDRGR
ncbi:MAG: hypothetical protein KJ558_16555 [Gammaproteobacteria bacterium]|nr:hypothetical protein [Gammaproteobacteria bacterium]MBU1656403.1 hypothetical protein [Gammaproteobacteria bacterium]MBU1960951.1 hypothetical protein [Gammaproteobacteria bacterium]